MDIPVDSAFLKQHITTLKIQQLQREHAERMQQDYGVFISYSHKDKNVARRLASFLAKRQIRHFLDEKTLRWGDRLGTALVEHMRELTHYVLILSRSSAKSRWCWYEWGLALGQQKSMLAFLTSPDVKVPPFAESFLATADYNRVKQLFGVDLINADAVVQFGRTLLNDGRTKLADFVPASSQAEASQHMWVAPDADEATRTRGANLRQLIDDHIDTRIRRLVRIEIGHSGQDPAMVLHYGGGGVSAEAFEVTYRADLSALVVESRSGVRKEGTDYVASVETQPSGEILIKRGSPKGMDLLTGKRWLYGWEMSHAFWVRVFEFLKGQLPVSS